MLSYRLWATLESEEGRKEVFQLTVLFYSEVYNSWLGEGGDAAAYRRRP